MVNRYVRIKQFRVLPFFCFFASRLFFLLCSLTFLSILYRVRQANLLLFFSEIQIKPKHIIPINSAVNNDRGLI